jgi:hypothetical protein
MSSLTGCIRVNFQTPRNKGSLARLWRIKRIEMTKRIKMIEMTKRIKMIREIKRVKTITTAR